MSEQLVNRRSGRRRNYRYEELEQKFQDAQNHWESEQDKASWDTMFTLIQLAVFNCINQKLEQKLEHEEIEARATDVTCTIMQGILNKRRKGLAWKIGRVSAFVHMPCMAVHSKELQFTDHVLGEESYCTVDESGEEKPKEFTDSYTEGGIVHLHGNPDTSDFWEKEEEARQRVEIVDAINVAVERVSRQTGETVATVSRIIDKVSEYGDRFENYLTTKEKTLLPLIRGEQPKEEQKLQPMLDFGFGEELNSIRNK